MKLRCLFFYIDDLIRSVAEDFPEMDCIVALTAFIYLVAAPFTKVEESFNIQACHDILYHGYDLYEYDHLEYPGVVPRTFIGALLVSSISYPFVTIIKILGLSKFLSQFIVRFVLGTLVFLAWKKLRMQIQKLFGPSVAVWFALITASQFHFIYYLSRPLPNTFALIFALLAFSFWLEQHHEALIFVSGISVLIFRSELCLLLGPMLLYDLSKRSISITKFLKHAVPAALICLASTVVIDSIFWLRLVWPEGEVFWFNTWKNQSNQWGVYPFLWYWYSCLPRALGLSLFLVPIGISIDPRVRTFVTPGLLFITLYSFLPHKELRFIIYVFPLLNVAAARACHFFWSGRTKSTMRQLLAIGSAVHILGNFFFSALLLTISLNNYPGGAAMYKFHQLVDPSELVHLHIDNFAAQTGVSRFTQLNPQWRYNKTEDLKAGSPEIRRFTHLLVEAKSKYAYNLKHYTISHEIMDSVDAFSHLNFNYLTYPPLKVRAKPAIFILKNLAYDDIDWSFKTSEEMEEKEAAFFSDLNSQTEVFESEKKREIKPYGSHENESDTEVKSGQSDVEMDKRYSPSKKEKKKSKKSKIAFDPIVQDENLPLDNKENNENSKKQSKVAFDSVETLNPPLNSKKDRKLET